MSVKRINLSFNLDREDDRKVYEILLSEKHKTEFIIGMVLGNSNFGNDDIKSALREVLNEYNFNLTENIKVEKKEEEIPAEIFNMFNSL